MNRSRTSVAGRGRGPERGAGGGPMVVSSPLVFRVVVRCGSGSTKISKLRILFSWLVGFMSRAVLPVRATPPSKGGEWGAANARKHRVIVRSFRRVLQENGHGHGRLVRA